MVLKTYFKIFYYLFQWFACMVLFVLFGIYVVRFVVLKFMLPVLCIAVTCHISDAQNYQPKARFLIFAVDAVFIVDKMQPTRQARRKVG